MTEQKFLMPLEEYLQVGLHIGTKFRTKYMEPFVYKIRPDGLSVLNVQKIDERIGIAAKFLAQYAQEDILVVCRRENGWKSVTAFSKVTGIKCYAGRYRPGILTNPRLEDFIEIKIILVVDPWPDKNALKEALMIGAPVIALCDTNNTANFVDLIIPCNNKGKKSLGLLFWVLAKEYLKIRQIIKKDSDLKATINDFSEEE